MSTRQGFTEGREEARTEHRDQYIISYKLNSTWIDPEGVCDRLRTVDECTVNPTDQYRGVERMGWKEGGASTHKGFCPGGRRREVLGLEW